MALRLYFGLQGSGKTYGMVADLLTRFKKSPVQVYTNIASLKVPEAIYFTDVSQLIDLSDGLILLDEVGIVLPAQFWHEVGRDLLVRICQMRHDGLDLWYTCQRENGVNVNLREQTNLTVRCSRVFGLLMQQLEVPDKKAKVATKIRRLEPRIYRLYDTTTNIGRSGGSVATLRGGARSRAAQAAGEQRRRELAKRTPKPVCALEVDRLSGWFGSPLRLVPRSDFRAALDWLHDHGHYLYGDNAPSWGDQVRRELRRREWLAQFSLGPDDAPVDCTPDNPWLAGHDPESVRERWDDLQETRAAETLVLLREKKRGRAVAV